jgi:F-type H+-transporting ATPase subunit b
MPQLDFANPLLLTQVLWLLVVFGALYVLLSKVALPPVAQVLADRETAINADLEAARALKAKADAAAAEQAAAAQRARAEAQAALRTAVDAAKAEAAKAEAQIGERLAADLAAAETRIAAAKTQALGAIRTVAAEAAVEATVKLTGLMPDAGAVVAAVDAALASGKGS